jgi:hypothetical protein
MPPECGGGDRTVTYIDASKRLLMAHRGLDTRGQQPLPKSPIAISQSVATRPWDRQIPDFSDFFSKSRLSIQQYSSTSITMDMSRMRRFLTIINFRQWQYTKMSRLD